MQFAARLWYLLLLLVGFASIAVGLWPSLLTLWALIAVPICVLAAVGIASPNALAARPRLLRAVRLGAYCLCAELLLVGAWLAVKQQRTVVLVAHAPAPTLVRLIYEVGDGATPSGPPWDRYFEVPANGVLHTASRADHGYYREGQAHALEVRLIDPSGDISRGDGRWVRGGYADAGGCRFEYGEYRIATPPAALPAPNGESPSDWLDSLPNWGVACRNRRLWRAARGEKPNPPTPTQVCYYEPWGGVACSTRGRTEQPGT